VVLALCLLAPGTRSHADEGDAPKPPQGNAQEEVPSYAGRDVTWWVKELRGTGTREAARAALRTIGEPAIPYLGPLLRHHDPQLRTSAVSLLRTTKGSLASIEDDVLALSGRADEDQERYDALALLGRIRPGTVKAVPALREALLDENSNVRNAAVDALRALSLPADVVVPLVARMLEHPSEEVRTSAYRLVKLLGVEGRSLRPKLEAVLRKLRQTAQVASRESYEMGQALEAVVDVSRGEPGAWSLVLEQVTDRHSPAQATRALQLLATFEPHPDDKVEPILDALEASRPGDRVHLLGAVGRLGGRGAPAVPWIVRQLSGGSYEVVEACGWALARIPEARAPRLDALLEAKDRWPNAPSLDDAIAACLLQELDVLFAHDPSVLTRTYGLLPVVQRHTQQIVAAGRAEALAAFLLPGLAGPGVPRQFDPEREAAQLEPVLAQAPKALAALIASALSDAPFRAQAATGILVRTQAGLGALRAALAVAPDETRPALLRVLADRARRELPSEDLQLLSGTLDGPQRFVAAEILGDNLRRLVERLSAERQRRLLAVALERLTLADAPEAPWALQLIPLLPATVPEAGPALVALYLAEDRLHPAHQLLWAVQHHHAGSPAETQAALDAAWTSGDPRLEAKAALALLRPETPPALAEEVQARLPRWLSSELAAARLWALGAWWSADYRAREGKGGAVRAHLALVRGLARDPDAQVAERALRGLVKAIGEDPETLATLRALLLDRTYPHRLLLVDALGMSDAAGVPLLVEGLDDPDLMRRCLSSLSSSILREHAQAARPRLKRLLTETPFHDEDLRRFIQIVLEGIPP